MNREFPFWNCPALDYRDLKRLGRRAQFAIREPAPGSFVHAFHVDGCEPVRAVCNSAEACVISRWLTRNGFDWREDCYPLDYNGNPDSAEPQPITV